VSIRQATEHDHDALRALWDEFEREQDSGELWADAWEDVWRETSDAGGFVLVAEEDDGVAGFAVGRMRRPRVAYLNDIYVRPQVRHRGVAKQLLAAVAAEGRRRGAEVLMLNVDLANAEARTVYRRLGFVEQSVRLVAGLDALENRVALTDAAPSFASTHVQTDDERAVQHALDQFLPRLGRSEHTEVTPASRGWVTVVDELCDRDRSAQRRLGAELSDRLGVPVVALALEEEAVVRFLLFDRGRMVDEYLSVPTYYGDLNKADELSLAANPTLVARLTGADPQRVRHVVRVASSPAELPPPRELLAQIADMMQLEARIER
jgi:ribosomal protein S18 acetylase RimI-like enzyme